MIIEKSKDNIIGATEVIIIGEAMIETWCKIHDHPSLNSSEKIYEISQYLGGMAVNSALALASLGCKCELISLLGPNVSVEFIQTLVNAGVSINKCFKSDTPTSLVYAFYNDEGYRHYHYLSEVPYQLALPAQEFPVGSIFLLAGSHYNAFQNLYRDILSIVSNDRVIFSPSYGIYSFEYKVLQEIIANSNILILNRQETSWLCNIFGLQEKDDVIGLGPNVFIYTQDIDGCIIFTKDGSITAIPAIPTKVVNPIGAGDAFNAGFLLGFTNHQSLRVCAQLGSSVASLCVARPETQVITNLEDVIHKCKTFYKDFSLL